MTPKNERHCRDCDFCVVRLKIPPKSGRELAEGMMLVIDNSRVETISCELGFWEKNFTSMAVFESSSLPKIAAENCSFYAPEDEDGD
jgi:hypothetical protein